MSVVAQLTGGPTPPFVSGCWLPQAPGRGVVGVVPYIRTPVLNLDTVIVYISVMVDGVARRAWVVPPSQTPTGAEAIQVCLESVARNLGCPGAGSPLQGTVGTPVTTTGPTAFVPLDAPLQILMLSTPVGAAVMGAAPVPLAVSSGPVPLTWTAAPSEDNFFPPPMPPTAGALHLAPLACVVTDGRVYTGTPYNVYDNSPQRNPMVALPVPGYSDVFTLAMCPPGPLADGSLPIASVTMTLVWPTCSVPVGRLVLPPALPARAARLDPCAVKAPANSNTCSTCPFYWTT